MGLDLKKTRENYEKKTEQKGGYDRWTPPVDKEVLFRVMPHTLRYFTESLDEIGYMFYLHFGVGPEGAQGAIVCPKTANRKNRCPVCEEIAMLKKSGEPSKIAEADGMGIRRRYLMNIIDLSDPKETAKGVQVWEAPGTAHDEVMKWCNERWGDPLDLENGRNLVLIKSVPGGNKKRTEYKVEPEPDKSSVQDKLPKDWKEQIKKLETLVPKFKTFDEIVMDMKGNVDYGEEHAVEKTSTAQHAAPAAQTDGPAAPAAAPAGSDVRIGEPIEMDVTTGKPKCFGEKYSMRSEKCKACGADKPVDPKTGHGPCKTKFLG